MEKLGVTITRIHFFFFFPLNSFLPHPPPVSFPTVCFGFFLFIRSENERLQIIQLNIIPENIADSFPEALCSLLKKALIFTEHAILLNI